MLARRSPLIVTLHSDCMRIRCAQQVPTVAEATTASASRRIGMALIRTLSGLFWLRWGSIPKKSWKLSATPPNQHTRTMAAGLYSSGISREMPISDHPTFQLQHLPTGSPIVFLHSRPSTTRFARSSFTPSLILRRECKVLLPWLHHRVTSSPSMLPRIRIW